MYGLCCSPSPGDEDHLKNGNNLTGKVVRQDDNEVVLETEFSGPLAIQRSFITELSIEPEAQIGVTHPENSQNPCSSQPAPANPCVILSQNWNSWANVGFSLTAGNAQTSTLTLGSKSTRITPSVKFDFWISNYWNHNRSIDQDILVLWGEARYQKYLNQGRWFLWGSTEFERDPSELLQMQVVPAGGLGYQVVKSHNTTLELYSGFDWDRAWYTGYPNRSTAEFVAGNILESRLSRKVNWEETFRLYPNLSDTGPLRSILDTTLTVNIARQMFLYISAVDRYESNPQPVSRTMPSCCCQGSGG